MIGADEMEDIRKRARGGESIASIARAVGAAEPTVRKRARMEDLSPEPPRRREHDVGQRVHGAHRCAMRGRACGRATAHVRGTWPRWPPWRGATRTRKGTSTSCVSSSRFEQNVQ